jgi:hypothetical protein
MMAEHRFGVFNMRRRSCRQSGDEGARLFSSHGRQADALPAVSDSRLAADVGPPMTHLIR